MFTLAQRKRLFAEQYLSNPQEVYQAGVAAWPDNPREGLTIAQEWVNDPEVLKICSELQGNGVAANVPTKEAIVKELLDLGRSSIGEELSDRLKAYELAVKMLGYIAPPQTNVQSNTLVTHNRVMVVREFPSDDEWERQAKAQQQRLISNHNVDDEPTKH